MLEVTIPVDEQAELVMEYSGFPQESRNMSTMQGSKEISAEYLCLENSALSPRLMNVMPGENGYPATIEITLPASMTAIPFGSSEAEMIAEHDNGTKTWRYEANGTGGILYAGDYICENIEAGGMTIEFYYGRKHQSVMEAAGAVEAVKSVVDYCTEHYGSLSFGTGETLKLIQSRVTGGGYATNGASLLDEADFTADNLGNADKGGGAGEGGSQRDRGHEPVQHEAHHKHREQHKPHGQRQNGALVLPQVARVRLASLVEQKRGDEQHEEQLGGDAHVVDGWNDQGHHRADGNLHKRQRQPRHNLAQHRRADDTSQHNERQFQNFHVRLSSSRNFPLTASIMPTPRFPWCQRPAPVSSPSRPRHVSRCGKASQASQAHRPVHPRTAPFGRARREFAQDFAIGRTQRAQKGRSYSPYRKILHTTIPKHSPYRKILHT